LANSAHAEWLKFAENGTTAIYVDPKAMKRTGDIIKVWILIDYKQPRMSINKVGKILSRRDLVMVDCRNETHATSQISEHSKRQAGGDILVAHKFTSLAWVASAPNTPITDIADVACKQLKMNS